MGDIFEQGTFQSYSKIRLDEARSSISQYSQYGIRKTTVFVSHKHEDLEELKGVLGFLQSNYGVKTYIDSQDPSMPKITSATTAYNLKDRIKKCDKFILLATNGAVNSKWCNWELGYGDAYKYQDNIALFPIKPKGEYDSAYKGSEYLSIYPYICFSDGTGHYKNGNIITKGYYVVTHKDGNCYYTSLANWFMQR